MPDVWSKPLLLPLSILLQIPALTAGCWQSRMLLWLGKTLVMLLLRPGPIVYFALVVPSLVDLLCKGLSMLQCTDSARRVGSISSSLGDILLLWACCTA